MNNVARQSGRGAILRASYAFANIAILTFALVSTGCKSVTKSSLIADDVHPTREEREKKFLAEFEQRRDKAQFQAAMSRLRTGETEIAQSMLQGIVDRNPAQLQARLALAEVLLDSNQTDEALQHAQYVVEHAPHEAAPKHLVGLILEAQGRTDEALGNFQQAADLDPQNEIYRLSFQTTAQTLAPSREKPTVASPHDVEATLAAATQALERGAPEESTRLLQAALQYAPNDVRLLRSLGLSHYRRGLYGEAQVVLAKAVSLDTTDPLSYFLLGATLRQMGQTAEAQPCLDTAAKLDPRYATWR